MLIRTRDELATTLEHRIISGGLIAGDLLPSERVLSEEFGLSRSMVREAIRTLAERRLIDVVPGRGSFVRQATVEDSADRLTDVFDQRQVTARYLIEARTMVEITTAAIAAERADEEEIDRIRTALEMFDSARSLLDRVRGDLAFHLAIVHAAKNPLIETMFRAIQPYTVESMVRSLTDDVVTDESIPFHRTILDAIVARKPAVASDAMWNHLAVGLVTYGDDLDRNLDVITRQSMSRLSDGEVTLQELLHMARDTHSGSRLSVT